MEHKITINDIARELNVSSATVHRALYGKKGVGDATRARILEKCAEYGFEINRTASALKRKPIRIAAVLPCSDDSDFYYRRSIWEGVDRAVAENSGAIELLRLPFCPESAPGRTEVLSTIPLEGEDRPDALLTIGYFSDASREILRSFVDHGLPVSLALDDDEASGRLLCMQPNYNSSGRLVAELLSSQLPHHSTVLVMAGDPTLPLHESIVQGFEEFIAENGVELNIRKLYGAFTNTATYESLCDILQNDRTVSGVFSITPGLSSALIQAIRSMDMAGRVRVVATGLFGQTRQALEDGVVQTIVFKDPGQQAYLALRFMLDYLSHGTLPEAPVNYVESKLIFRSNLPYYK